MCEVALKAIPKNKVKGNEEGMWSEMRVLQGLDHHNTVGFISPLLRSWAYAGCIFHFPPAY